MRKVALIRTESGDQGTFGVILFGKYNFVTVELPWKDNNRGVSCIPFGKYNCEIVQSPHFGEVYQVKDVQGRSHILLHSGNWGGDKTKGLRTDTDGCIILGKRLGFIYKQKAVKQSRCAFDIFMEEMNKEPFELDISGLDLW